MGSMAHPVENNFVELLEAYKAIVYKVASLYTQTTQDREDLFQEIVINLWKAYPGFRGDSKVSTWIYRISLNTAITNYRQKKNKVRYEPMDHLVHNEVGMPSRDGQLDQLSILYQAIEVLPKIDKAIILLFLEEKSYREISQIMGITTANVGMRIKRIKEKLSKRFINIKL